MNRLLFWLCLALLVVPGVASAVTVTDGSITSGILDRQPVDQIKELPAGTSRVYCFTRVQDVAAGGFVVHTWYWGDREMARV